MGAHCSFLIVLAAPPPSPPHCQLGVTLTELSDIFTGGAAGFPYVATHAVNMDGGGSTTMSASPLWPAAPAQVGVS
jgi:hypothetical protein